MIHHEFLLVQKKINEFPLFIYLQLIVKKKGEEKMASQAKNTFEIPKWFVDIERFYFLFKRKFI